MAEQTQKQELLRAAAQGQTLWKDLRLALAALGSAAIQGLCAFLVAMNAIKAALGISGAAAAGGSSLIHSDPVRLALRYVSAALATLTLYVIWNAWKLRTRGASHWRKVPLTGREKWTIGLGLASALTSWFLIIAEVYAHQRIHPG